MPVIDKMFAFIVTDNGPEDEGVPAVYSDQGWMPLVGADMRRVDILMPMAVELARESGKSITLVEFSTRRTVKVIPPTESH